MNYIKAMLGPNERIRHTTRVSLFSYGSKILACIVILAIASINEIPRSIGHLLEGFGFDGIAVLIDDIPRSWIWMGAFFACAILLLLPFLEWKCGEYAVTNQRIIVKTGIIGRDVFEMPLRKIESVNLVQNIVNRFLNYGSVTICGTGDTKITLDSINDPEKFRRAVNIACNDLDNFRT